MERGKLELVFGIQVVGYSGLMTKAVAASPASYSVCGSVWLHSSFELYYRGWAMPSLYSGSTLLNHSNFFLLPLPTRYLVAKLQF